MGNVFLSPGISLLNMNKFPYGENEWNILLLEPECSTLYSLLYSYNVYKLHMSVNYYNWEVLSLSTKLPFSTPPLSIFRFTEDIHIQILDLHINIFIKIFISVFILMYLRVNFLFTENFLLYHFFFLPYWQTLNWQCFIGALILLDKISLLIFHLPFLLVLLSAQFSCKQNGLKVFNSPPTMPAAKLY